MSLAADTTLPPGPSSRRPGMIARFLLRPDAMLEDCYRRYGDFFKFVTPEKRVLCISANPEINRQVFRGDPSLLHAGEGNSILAPLLGPHSVLLLDGERHLRQRKLLLPPFHGERMREYGELMRAVAERHVARWPTGEPLRTIESTQAITLEIIQRAVFGIEDAARLEHVGGRLRSVMDPLADRRRMMVLLLAPSEWGPRSPWGRFRARVRVADDAIYEEIRARRADPGSAERGDIMSLLLEARYDDGEGLSDRELRDELVTLLVAGHETTATSLAWALERIVRQPEVLERLQDGEDEEYLDAVIKETLRLRPVIPAVIRKLKGPFEVGGYRLPEGAYVVPSIYLTHRRPDIYPEPLAFRPQRFLDSPPSGSEYLPFGGGVRRCLGASFALFEMRVVLQTILRNVRLRAPDAEPERIVRRAITFAPSRGATILADARRGTILADAA